MLFFLSGLPRSGSTLLAAILNQHPELYVTPTSGLFDLMGAVARSWENNPTIAVQGRDNEELFRLLRSIAEGKYEHIAKPFVMDKNREWPNPKIMETMTEVLGETPRIVATVRNVADCAASFVKIAKPENVETFLFQSGLIKHLKASYLTLKMGMEAAPDNFCVIDYDDLMDDPKAELNRIVEFLDLSPFEFDFDQIEGSVVEEHDEEIWNIPGLHDVRPKLGRQVTVCVEEILGDRYVEFQQPAFWRGEKPIIRKDDLDLQVEAGLRGDFELGWEITQKLATEQPGNMRASFNRGWYLLRQGRLQEGMALLNTGRDIEVFGNPIGSRTPLWDGRTPTTVLLNLEGGLGDQIHGVRFARDIAARSCKVIVACSPELAPIFDNVEGVTAVVQHGASVYHNAWVPSMTAVLPLGYEYKNLSGRPYIERPYHTKNKRPRIGLRWSGNPEFENQQHRLFPVDLMFAAVKDLDADFISLQRDNGSDLRPDWVKEVCLDEWTDTIEAINSCDLVISSCTSLAHMAGAMGVKTWIVVPILSYYLWSLPGEKTPYYDSVSLFRQTEFGDWAQPFEDIAERLRTEINTSN